MRRKVSSLNHATKYTNGDFELLIADNEYELRYKGDLIFEGDQYRAGRMTEPDSPEAAGGLLGFLCLKPGDTDADYFKDYTPEQLRFVEQHGDELYMWGDELENGRFDPDSADEIVSCILQKSVEYSIGKFFMKSKKNQYPYWFRFQLLPVDLMVDVVVFDQGSRYGIDGGPISKMWIYQKGQMGHLFVYDRGFDKGSENFHRKNKDLIHTIIPSLLENHPVVKELHINWEPVETE